MTAKVTGQVANLLAIMNNTYDGSVKQRRKENTVGISNNMAAMIHISRTIRKRSKELSKTVNCFTYFPNIDANSFTMKHKKRGPA